MNKEDLALPSNNVNLSRFASQDDNRRSKSKVLKWRYSSHSFVSKVKENESINCELNSEGVVTTREHVSRPLLAQRTGSMVLHDNELEHPMRRCSDPFCGLNWSKERFSSVISDKQSLVEECLRLPMTSGTETLNQERHQSMCAHYESQERDRFPSATKVQKYLENEGFYSVSEFQQSLEVEQFQSALDNKKIREQNAFNLEVEASLEKDKFRPMNEDKKSLVNEKCKSLNDSKQSLENETFHSQNTTKQLLECERFHSVNEMQQSLEQQLSSVSETKRSVREESFHSRKKRQKSEETNIGKPICRQQSLQTGEFKWKENTLDTTSSWVGSRSGQQLKYKVILLGDCGVGKTSFLQTLVNGGYLPKTPSNNLTMSGAVKTLQYMGKDVQLHFYDTAGQERYRSLTASYYRQAHGCIVFFNVNVRQSFLNVESWLDDLNKYGNPGSMVIILVGLCHKLRSKAHHNDKQRFETCLSDNATRPHLNDNVTISEPHLNDQCSSLTRVTNNTSSCTSSSVFRNSRSVLDVAEVTCTNREVPRTQAEHLASTCSIPYIEVDIQNDHRSVIDTMDRLMELLTYRALQSPDKVIFIKPLTDKSAGSKPCSPCCSVC